MLWYVPEVGPYHPTVSAENVGSVVITDMV